MLISMAAATRPCFFTRVVCHHPSTSQGYGNASRTTYVPRRAASRGLKNTSVVSLRRTGTHCLTCHSRSSQAKGWEDGLRRMAYAEGVRGVRTCWGGGGQRIRLSAAVSHRAREGCVFPGLQTCVKCYRRMAVRTDSCRLFIIVPFFSVRAR